MMSMESRLVAKYKINLGVRALVMVAGKCGTYPE